MKEVIQLITRLMNLVIGALDQVETQMTRLEGRIGSIESRPAAVVSSPGHPSAGIPSPPSPQGGGVAEELRSAVTKSPPGGSLPGMPGEAPSGYGAPPASGPVVEGGWEAGFQGLAKAPEPAPPPAGGPGGSGLGIRSALQNELKDAFKRLKSSMDEED